MAPPISSPSWLSHQRTPRASRQSVSPDKKLQCHAKRRASVEAWLRYTKASPPTSSMAGDWDNKDAKWECWTTHLKGQLKASV